MIRKKDDKELIKRILVHEDGILGRGCMSMYVC